MQQVIFTYIIASHGRLMLTRISREASPMHAAMRFSIEILWVQDAIRTTKCGTEIPGGANRCSNPASGSDFNLLKNEIATMLFGFFLRLLQFVVEVWHLGSYGISGSFCRSFRDDKNKNACHARH